MPNGDQGRRKEGADQRDDDQRKERRNNIVEHDPETAFQMLIEIANRRRFHHIEETKDDKADELAPESRGRHEQ